jgi:predicted secreted protein
LDLSARNLKTNTAEALLAFGASDGSVGLVKIIQRLQSSTGSPGLISEYTIEAVFDDQVQNIFQADKRGITALAWVECPGRSVSMF